MKILTVAVTALVVSLDSFMAGFSLSLNKRSSPTLPSAVALITLLLCIVTSVAGQALLRYAEKIVDYLGAALLMLLAITALFRRDDRRSALAAVSLRESIAIGVAVGMDAAIANFAFAGRDALYDGGSRSDTRQEGHAATHQHILRDNSRRACRRQAVVTTLPNIGRSAYGSESSVCGLVYSGTPSSSPSSS